MDAKENRGSETIAESKRRQELNNSGVKKKAGTKRYRLCNNRPEEKHALEAKQFVKQIPKRVFCGKKMTFLLSAFL